VHVVVIMAYFNMRPSNFGTYLYPILQPNQMSCVTGVGNTAVTAYKRDIRARTTYVHSIVRERLAGVRICKHRPGRAGFTVMCNLCGHSCLVCLHVNRDVYIY